jgi:tripartite-type tricarboxylate transporter receptor subunit TctC
VLAADGRVRLIVTRRSSGRPIIKEENAMRNATAATIALLVAALGLPASVAAQSYPARPVRMIVPFPAGGNVDVFARVLYRYVEEELGQPVIIDNRGGANGILGADIVAKASADGHTMLNTSFAFAVNPFVRRKMPFQVEKDFTPVTMVALGTGYLQVIHPEVPVKTVKELIALAQKQPLRYSTAGVANGQHLAGALFAHAAGIKMLHVPYKGGAPAMTAVVSGETQVHYPAAAVGIPHVKAGRVRATGFTGNQRLRALPDVPTIAEAGLSGFFADAGWHGVFAPAGTPAPAVRHMQQSIHKALQIPRVRDHFLDGGYEPSGMPPAQWAEAFRADLKRYAEIVRIAEIEPE